MTASSRGLSLLLSLAVVGVACASEPSAVPVTTLGAPATSAEPVPASTTPTSGRAISTQPSSAPVSDIPTRTLDADQCLTSLPFVATYLPDGWSSELQIGSGGEVGVDSDGTVRPLDPPSPYFVHYSGHAVRLGSYINFALGVGEPALSYEPLTVMGGAAQFGKIEDGYLVVFLAADSPCGQYSMLAYGVTADDARRVAEGLVPVP